MKLKKLSQVKIPAFSRPDELRSGNGVI